MPRHAPHTLAFVPFLTDRTGAQRVPAAGTGAGRPASEPSRASGRAGPVARAAAAARAAGWAGARGQGRLAAVSSPAPAAVREAPPPAAAERSAVLAGGARWGGRPGAACRGAAAAGCAGWRRSAPEAPWTGRTAAGFASARRAERPEGQEAFLLQDRNSPSSVEFGARSIVHAAQLTSRCLSQTRYSEPSHTPTGNFAGGNFYYITSNVRNEHTKKDRKALDPCKLASSRTGTVTSAPTAAATEGHAGVRRRGARGQEGRGSLGESARLHRLSRWPCPSPRNH